jgi:hypothetical protein
MENKEKIMQIEAIPNLRKRRVIGFVPASYAKRAKMAAAPKEIPDTMIRRTPMRCCIRFITTRFLPAL